MLQRKIKPPAALLGRIRDLVGRGPEQTHANADVPARTGRPPARLSLALQGGGSYGAFTWGVLDRLLEDGKLDFDTLSGSSAGAINAALLAHGLAKGGREAAREQLERFWRRASGAAPAPSLSLALSVSTRMLSPYQLNPFDLNPLRLLLDMEIDFAQLRKSPAVRLLIGATRVSDGRLRLFRETEISADVLLASACLPLLQQAVEIDGVNYWDGGYAANPPLMPLVQDTRTADVLVVQVVPTQQATLPRSVPDITRRLEHMTFNASLLRDLDMLADAPPLVAGGPLKLSRVAAEDHVPGLDQHSALQLDWSFLRDLRDAGRKAAADWLAGQATGAAAAAAPQLALPSPASHKAVSPSRKVG
jgi:NTE family protein